MIFVLLQEGGNIAPEELARTFNCGIGMAVIVSEDKADKLLNDQSGFGAAQRIGRIEAGQRGCTVRGKAGSWNSTEDWSATHNA